jgi:DNA polymerase
MSQPSDLAAHLRLFADLGVTGVSQDPAWRERTQPDPVLPLAREREVGHAAELATSGVQGMMTRADTEPVRFDPDSAPPSASAPESAPAGAGLAAIREDIGDCTRCALHTLGRRQIVFGVGNPSADLMFVGEAPGADEDIQGEPFVGRAGQLLTKIIEAIGLSRSDVYIANVLKCRPPGNRNPQPIEVSTCQPFLQRQIDTVRPKVIVALGTFAAQTLLATETPISRLRGRVHDFRDGIRLIPTFHPAFLLRSPDRKRDVWEDMKIVRALLAESD